MRKRFCGLRESQLRGMSLGVATSLLTLAMVGTGCDTVAQISFPERTFQSVRPVAMNPSGSIANLPRDVCGSFDGDATMRMVLLANDGTAIKEGEAVSLRDIDLRRSDVTFDGVNYYSYPNVPCEDNGDCSGGMTCAEAANPDYGKRCIQSRTVSVAGDPTFVGEEPGRQAIAVVMSHEGRMRGWLPADLGNLFLVDENGVQIEGKDNGINTGRAVDNTRDRFGALRQLRQDWENLVKMVEEDGREAYFGLWSFGESSATETSWTAESSGDDSAIWTRQPSRVSSAIEAFDSNPDAVRADVYQSVNSILTKAFGPDTVASAIDTRTLVLIVGGHDERRRPNMTVDTVIETARELGVRVHVVQADPEIDTATLRDDYRYYEQQQPCATDSECKNFEECREPQYLCQSNGNTCTGINYPQNPGDQFCLPKRDENGRLGPIHDYQRLACETGGGYSYLPAMTNSLLYNRMSGLAMEREAAWEVDIRLDDVNALTADSPYALEAAMKVNVSNQERTYNFSTAGITGTAGQPYSRDTRAIFFTPVEE